MLNQMEKTFEGIVAGTEMELLELKIVPNGDNQVLVCASEGMELKRFSRQCSLLDGYICLALGGAPSVQQPARLEELNVPAQEDGLGKAAVWYAMACRSEDAHKVTMAVYNGFGALSGGYEQVEQRAETYLGSWKERFQACVQAAKWDEDDAGNCTGPEPGIEVWKGLDLNVMREGLRRAIGAEQ